MTCTLGGLIQYHVQFMCSKIACLIYDQANIGGAIAPPAPMVPTPMHGIYKYVEYEYMGREHNIVQYRRLGEVDALFLPLLFKCTSQCSRKIPCIGGADYVGTFIWQHNIMYLSL